MSKPQQVFLAWLVVTIVSPPAGIMLLFGALIVLSLVVIVGSVLYGLKGWHS